MCDMETATVQAMSVQYVSNIYKYVAYKLVVEQGKSLR